VREALQTCHHTWPPGSQVSPLLIQVTPPHPPPCVPLKILSS
jgi:hypothetical protein